MVIYEVLVEWACSGESGTTTELFKCYEKAKDFYNETIKEECDNSWILDALTDGKPDYGYTLEESSEINDSDLSWEFYENGHYSTRHTSIYLTKKIIK